MGRLVLVARLAWRDLRHRRTETTLLVLAMLAATTTLTLGLVVRDVASTPYQSTREATAGPDVVASVEAGVAGDDVADLQRLAAAPGAARTSGPFPAAPAELVASDRTSDVQVVGRDDLRAAVDRPRLLDGGWVRDGGVVVEAAFATAMGVTVGDTVTMSDAPFDVVGVAVTAAAAPYPQATCYFPCLVGAVPDDLPADEPAAMVVNPGLVWATDADARELAAQAGTLAWVLNLRLTDPAGAESFVAEQEAAQSPAFLRTWRAIQADATETARDAQIVLLFGSSLLSLLAIASVAVLVGGRMADQTRRVGLLKAVGATPRLVAAVLLAEHVLVAVVAAAAGLVLGSLLAPLLTTTGAGLVGGVSPPALTPATALVVVGVALAVAGLATFGPALRAARTSTVRALADSARPPRRTGWLVRASAHLPAPLLLAVRVAARRPRRAVLGITSIMITVAGLVVALAVRAEISSQQATGGLDEARVAALTRVVLIVTVVLLCLAAVNALFLTWATVLDYRRPSGVARALGATPRDVTVAVAGAQVLPALVGAVLGVVPASILLFALINAINPNDNDATLPPLWQLAVLVAGTVLVVTALTLVPAGFAARRSVAAALRVDDA